MSVLFPPWLSLPRMGMRNSIVAYKTGISGSTNISSATVAAATASNGLEISASMAAIIFNTPNHLPFRLCTHGDACCLADGTKTMKSLMMSTNSNWSQRKRHFTCPASFPIASTSSLYDGKSTRGTSGSDVHLKVLETAREKFTQEVSLQSKGKEISLAKALLYIAAEDEAFRALNKQMDAPSILDELRDGSSNDLHEDQYLELMPLDGKIISEWLSELDAIAREVEAELVSRDIGCHLIEVLEAVNLVLFEQRAFKRLPVAVDPKFSYLPWVLRSGSGSAILLSIIYTEVCQRLGLTILGSRVGEDFLIWPQTENPQELFKVTSGRSLFAIINGRCVEDPRSMASDLNSSSLAALDIAANRDIVGIALANLVRLHWKRASRMNPGLMLTSALRPVHSRKQHGHVGGSNHPLLQTQDLRLAMMALERLLIVQPHNWTLRRDHGMMLYYNREYGEAIQELSICMAICPEEEVAVLEPFVEKLHLIRLESTWKSWPWAMMIN